MDIGGYYCTELFHYSNVVGLMIILNNITKSFEGLQVLKGISITFEPGKTNLIIGQSGSGKTVLLKCLLGLYQIDGGKMHFNNQAFGDMNDQDRRTLRREMGMVFQGSALFDSMSVLENVMFPMQMLTKKSESEIKRAAEEVIERVNLENANNKLPAELSGGMQKRVAIARAVVMKPKYLFCDEPNSGLDPKTAIVIDNLIREITQENNITTVINSHDMNSVMEIGDTILFLKDGVKAWEGSKEQIFKSDNEAVNDFVYSSNLMKKIKQVHV
jgi:phospholipid/cholesterol/gamma-HCH transport system ATP-binding protein